MVYLFIEFLDELVFGVTDAAWPLIRADLELNYIQIGLALSLPGIVSVIIEPFLGILGDVWKRRTLILGGGVFFALALFLTGASQSFLILLFSFILFYPSSGAFVSLSQATLMDSNPSRHEQNMVRWTLSGSIGVVLGSLLMAAAAFIGFGWRGMFFTLAGLALIFLFAAWWYVPRSNVIYTGLPRFRDVAAGFLEALRAFRCRNVLRWLVLLEFQDLMSDVLYGFLALYFVDVAGLAPAQAALAVAIWTGSGLLGDVLLIPLLERLRGLDYLRFSVVLELILFPTFLIVQVTWIKMILIALLSLFAAGWYAILQGNLYSSLPGRSGSVMMLGTVTGLFGKLLPLGIGLLAERLGLGIAMWLLLLGPIALLVGLPRRASRIAPYNNAR